MPVLSEPFPPRPQLPTYIFYRPTVKAGLPVKLSNASMIASYITLQGGSDSGKS